MEALRDKPQFAAFNKYVFTLEGPLTEDKHVIEKDTKEKKKKSKKDKKHTSKEKVDTSRSKEEIARSKSKDIVRTASEEKECARIDDYLACLDSGMTNEEYAQELEDRKEVARDRM